MLRWSGTCSTVRAPWGGFIQRCFSALTSGCSSGRRTCLSSTPKLSDLLMEAATQDYDAVVPLCGDYYEPLLALYNRRCLQAIADVLERSEKMVVKFYKYIRVRNVPEKEWRTVDPEGISFKNVNFPEDLDKPLMDLTEAIRNSLDLAPGPQGESVPLEEALGRVLHEDLAAHWNLPGESRSRLDGFAVLSSDTGGASPNDPVVLKIVPGVLAAGHLPRGPLRPGECVRILTGAPVPFGADAVVPQEQASEHGERLSVREPVKHGKGVVFPGADVGEGDLLLSKGAVLTPSRLALVAALGYRELPVYRKPRVALLSTGDEVREMGAFTEGPWTFCNNRLLLGWLVSLQGGSTHPSRGGKGRSRRHRRPYSGNGRRCDDHDGRDRKRAAGLHPGGMGAPGRAHPVSGTSISRRERPARWG